MDSYEFARGVARIMERGAECGLMKVVDERRAQLARVSDPNRPYRVLAHIIVDTVAPEHVFRLLPQGVVTVREAARVLMGLADHSRLTPRGAPVVMDREMCLFVRQSIFSYFLHLLTFDRYADAKERPEQSESGQEAPHVGFGPEGVLLNGEALGRWTFVIIDPERFRVVGRFLDKVPKSEYGLWYFRAVEAIVSLAERPSAEDLELVLDRLRQARPMN